MIIPSSSLTEYNINDIKKALDTRISDLSTDGVYDYLIYPTYTVQQPSKSGPFWIGDNTVIKWNYTEQLSDLIPSTSISIYENDEWEKELFTDIKTSVKNVNWTISSSLGLKLDTQYYIRVYSYIDGVKIEDSSTSFTVDRRYITITSQVPAKPILANAGNTLDISWNENGAGDYYKIEMIRAYGEDGEITTILDEKYYSTSNTYTWSIEDIEPDTNVNDDLNMQEIRIKVTDIQNNISAITGKINLLVPYIEFIGTVGRKILSAQGVDDVIIAQGPGEAELSLYAFDPANFRVPYEGSFTFNYDSIDATEVYLTKLSDRAFYETLPRLSGVYRIDNIIKNERYSVNARDIKYLIKSASFDITLVPKAEDTGSGGGGGGEPIDVELMTNLEFLQYCVSLGEESLISGNAIIDPQSNLYSLIPQYKKESSEMDVFTPCETILYVLKRDVVNVLLPLNEASYINPVPELGHSEFLYLGVSNLRNKIAEAIGEYNRRGGELMCLSKIILFSNSLQLQSPGRNIDSQVASYEIQGKKLISDIIISSPEGFRISTSPTSDFSQELTIPISTVESKKVKIYVIFNSGESIYNANIIHKTNENDDVLLSVEGTIPPQMIFTNISELNFGDVDIFTPHYLEYTVRGIDMPALSALHINSPMDYKISIANKAYAKNQTIYSVNGQIPDTIVAVEYIPSGVGQSTNIIQHHVGEGITVSNHDITVRANSIGGGENSSITVNPTSINFGSEVNIGGNIKTNYYVKSNYIEDDLYISVPAPFSLRVPPQVQSSNDIVLVRNQFGAISDTMVELKFAPTEVGTYSENIEHRIGFASEDGIDLPVSGFTRGFGNVNVSPTVFNLGKINIEGFGVTSQYLIYSSVAIANDVEIHASENSLIAESPFTNYVKTIYIPRDSNGKIGQPNGKIIKISFKPPTTGIFTEVIKHNFVENPASFADIIVNAEGVSGGVNNIVTVNPTELDFGVVPMNVSAVKSYTLSMSNDVINVNVSTTPFTGLHNFKVSLSPTGPFTDSIIVNNADNTNKTIYVEFNSTQFKEYNEQIWHISSMSTDTVILNLKGIGGTP